MALHNITTCTVHRCGIVERLCEVQALRHEVLLHANDVLCFLVLHFVVSGGWNNTSCPFASSLISAGACFVYVFVTAFWCSGPLAEGE
jgi:hypothetical protein